MTASVIYLQNALTPQNRRVDHVSPRSIRSLSPDWRTPHIALLDGRAVLRADWDRQLHHGQTLAFIDVAAIPQGGEGGSDPLRIMLMLAVMVIAPQAGAWLGGQMLFNLPTGSMALAAVEVAATVAGMAIVNSLLPLPRATTPQQAAALAAPSPTYSLQAQGNAARLEAAIPEHFGRLVAYPDFAAQPYAEYSGNEQYLYQLLCIGRGEYDIEAIRVEDTAITSFEDIVYEVVPPNQAVTLFPANVTTAPEVSGQDLGCVAATYERTGTTVTVTLAGHGYTVGKILYVLSTSGGALGGFYSVTTVPTADTFTLTTTASGTIAAGNTCTVALPLGPFNASAPGTQSNFLGFDFVFPRGIYYATDSGALADTSVTLVMQAGPIDDAGVSIGAWVTLATETIAAATTTPQRRSFRYNVAAGRYRVRIARTSVKQTDNRYGNEVAWAGLRAYLPDTRTYGDVTLLAMRLRASNNLSMQASRKVNVIATRKLPVWDGSTWSANTATSSIAWAMAYACKQVGLTDAQIDLPTLLALDATWASRGDEFNGRFDSFLSFWEAVSKIAAAGRAKAYMQGGVVRLMRDQAQTLPVQLFSMRNIARGSLSVEYLMPTVETADAIDVGYFDQVSWAPRRVRAMLPDSTAERPVKVEMFGVTARDQAYREGLYLAANNRYRRKRIKFTTEMEGFIPSFGDLIAIQHDMPAWGQSGEITGWNPATKTATLSDVPNWGAGVHYIALRNRDGSVDGPYAAVRGGTERDVILASLPVLTPYTGGGEERTHYSFGAAETWRQPARVLAIRPRGLASVEIEAVNEDPNVHNAELGTTTPSENHSALIGYTNAPIVTGLIARSSRDDPLKMLLSWQPSAWADRYLIEQSSDGENWTRSGETGSNNYAVTALYGSATLIRVAAFGIARGPWVQIAYGDEADYMWSALDSTLMWSVTTTDTMWRY